MLRLCACQVPAMPSNNGPSRRSPARRAAGVASRTCTSSVRNSASAACLRSVELTSGRPSTAATTALITA